MIKGVSFCSPLCLILHVILLFRLFLIIPNFCALLPWFVDETLKWGCFPRMRTCWRLVYRSILWEVAFSWSGDLVIMDYHFSTLFKLLVFLDQMLVLLLNRHNGVHDLWVFTPHNLNVSHQLHILSFQFLHLTLQSLCPFFLVLHPKP